MKVAIADCGSGNLRSVVNAFARVFDETGIEGTAEITASPNAIARADRVVLPGVGAFSVCRQGIEKQRELGEALEQRVRKDGVPFLGICVGMQLLAQTGYEDGATPGFGWLDGEVRRLPEAPGRPTPHMGWNDFDYVRPHPLFEGIAVGSHAYFVHSYHYESARAEDVLATVQYGTPLVAALARGNIAGTQFHPEKSQQVGLRMLANFLRWSP